MWNCYEEEKKKHLNSTGQVKCEKRVREENLSFPSNKNTTKKNQQWKQGFKHTHTHKNEIDYLGSFFSRLYILDFFNLKIFFFVFLYSSAMGEGGMCIPTFVDFFRFHFFFFVSFVFFFFSFFLSLFFFFLFLKSFRV